MDDEKKQQNQIIGYLSNPFSNMTDGGSTITSAASSQEDLDLREREEEEAFSNFTKLIRDIRESYIEEDYKNDLIGALESTEKSWRFSVNEFQVDKIGNNYVVINAGGFKTIYRGTLQIRDSKGSPEYTTIPVANLQETIAESELPMRKGSIWR